MSFTNFWLWCEKIWVGQTIFELKLWAVLAIILMARLGVYADDSLECIHYSLNTVPCLNYL